MIMSMLSGDENPMFTMEHDKDTGTKVGAEVTVKAKLTRKTESVEKDGEPSFTCEYEVLSVDGENAEDPEDATDPEDKDDMDSLNEMADEEVSKES